jgi:hypothetical protein
VGHPQQAAEGNGNEQQHEREGHGLFPLHYQQANFIIYYQWLIFLTTGNTMKNTMHGKSFKIHQRIPGKSRLGGRHPRGDQTHEVRRRNRVEVEVLMAAELIAPES